MAKNTTSSIGDSKKETAESELTKQVKEAAARLKAEKTVKVSIPKALEKNIGPTLCLGINGVQLVIPVNGKEYEVPTPYKAVLDEYLDNLKS
jgi:hypothetical protein